ncbi:hypothetical protein BGX38DRAFT_928130 [Terfezia claveryi]|nr:hypothetical protein BGX38DRAFT_928130 [Terfezia claveryi]
MSSVPASASRGDRGGKHGARLHGHLSILSHIKLHAVLSVCGAQKKSVQHAVLAGCKGILFGCFPLRPRPINCQSVAPWCLACMLFFFFLKSMEPYCIHQDGSKLHQPLPLHVVLTGPKKNPLKVFPRKEVFPSALDRSPVSLHVMFAGPKESLFGRFPLRSRPIDCQSASYMKSLWC